MSVQDEIIIDNFCGGGGASLGIEMALGRSPDVAINHDETAIDMHMVNHPHTRHHCQNTWQVDPRDAADGKRVGLAWFSPDCKDFSKAKGGKPVRRNIRDLAWVVVLYAERVRPRVIAVENVEEFEGWGPLDENNRRIKDREGETFQKWVRALRSFGYKVEWKQLRASDYGAGTIRKRLFIIARCDGRPIVWPKPTHFDPKKPYLKRGGMKPWRQAWEYMDFRLPCPSILMDKEQSRQWRELTGQSIRRPLADASYRRIMQGIDRHVINCEDPFILPPEMHDGRLLGQPATVPFLTEHANASAQRTWSIKEPLRTQCANVKGGHFALVQASMIKHYGGVVGSDLRQPAPTCTTRGTQNQLLTTHLVKYRGTCKAGQSVREPMPGLTAGGTHVGEVRAMLQKYYGAESSQHQSLKEPLHTISTKERFGIVTVAGNAYQIVDIGMRMLAPMELAGAQGFHADYRIDVRPDGRPITKTDQVAAVGNSVPPHLAKAIVAANVPELAVNRRAAQ